MIRKVTKDSLCLNRIWNRCKKTRTYYNSIILSTILCSLISCSSCFDRHKNFTSVSFHPTLHRLNSLSAVNKNVLSQISQTREFIHGMRAGHVIDATSTGSTFPGTIMKDGEMLFLDNTSILSGISAESSVGSKRTKMYLVCCVIVFLWVSIGTLFYAWFNKWPIPQSFFYAIDAGMSIGFCTDVAETKVASRAFTVVYILLGASCVGGALALFVEDILEGITRSGNKDYRLLLEQDAFHKADYNKTGAIRLDKFRDLITGFGYTLEEDVLIRLSENFDPENTGSIRYHEFIHRYRGIGHILKSCGDLENQKLIPKLLARAKDFVEILCGKEYRIFVVFNLWISMGIAWGIVDQKWDPITATHFAISALATGGLTAPPVGEDGILPASSAIFCGIYCLFGIPLFALTLGHFARILVQGHIVSAERKVISTPIQVAEFEFAKSLCSDDDEMHLSDFIVMQLLRQKKINMDTVNILKNHFDSLDTDKSRTLNLKEATTKHIVHNSIIK